MNYDLVIFCLTLVALVAIGRDHDTLAKEAIAAINKAIETLKKW